MKMNTAYQRFSKSAIALATAGILSSLPMTAAANEQTGVQGRVTDVQNKVYFEGAQVEIKQLGVKTVTRRDGSFSFKNVPDGEYTLVIHYIGVPKVEKQITVVAGKVENQNYVIGANEQAMENVIVYGQRAGQAGAINRQKNARSLKSIVSADAIGQLPDQNAAEALQRLPGMFIQRDQGEGRFIGIRGIDPNLNNVTINGVNVPSPEAGIRSVAMDVIPSELIQSLEVSKTTTPDMDASAVGGSIEVKSLSAFDRQDESYSVTAQTSYNQLMSENSPKLSGSYSDIYQLDNGVQLGVATALSWFERKFGSHNLETDGGWDNFEFEDAATGEDVEVFGAEEIEQRLYQITRERLGAAINFDLYTSTTDKYYLRTLYSKFSDDEYRLRNEYKFDKGQVDLAQTSATDGTFIDAEMERGTKDRFESQKILSVVAGGENLVGNWLVEYNLGYSKSSENEPNRIDTAFKGKDLTLGYQAAVQPVLTHSAAAHDLSNFELDEVVVENNLSEDEENSFAIDFSQDFVWDNYNGQVKFGAKHRTREKFNRVEIAVYDGGFNDATAAEFAINSVDYDLSDFGPGISRSAMQSFVASNQAGFELNANESLIENAGSSYSSEEDISAAYAMVSVDFDDWYIVAGLRYEDTSYTTVGNQVELIVDDVNDDERVEVSEWALTKDYSHFFPSLNVRYLPSDNIVTRFAYSETIARPTFGDSAAFQLIESEISEDDGEIETERKAEVGNPILDPYESRNLDFSIEYYPGHIGVLSAGIFYKDIDNFIQITEVQDNGAWDGFDEVVQAVNGGEADLTGLELAWTKNFESGLFVSANATFVDTDSKLPNQADEVGNLSIGFENTDFSVRLSASYKSESFQFEDGGAGVYQDTHTQYDLSVKYYLTDTMQVFFNGINLADEPYYLYHGQSNYNYQYEQYGRSFELGFTLTSF